ncbi:hypothetical protein JW898_01400 [Candidatus Woesearchaeota archaeon]|nr:hypothetical protein [Candidatus Woesearchaeota archaeon]
MRKKRLKGNTLVIMVVCAALVTIGAVLLFFSLFALYKVYDVRMSIEVSDRSGFNTDTDSINFGKAMPGNSNTRTMVMSHDFSRPLLVHFRKSGNISAFVALPDDFYLEPGLIREVPIHAIIPDSAAEGEYEGNLRVYFRRI